MTQGRSSFDVHVWGLQKMTGKRGTTHGVRWRVAGRRHRRTFASAKLADTFRAELLSAVRKGRPFDVDSGLPAELQIERTPATWWDIATTYTTEKWSSVSPNHRRGIAEALTDATIELTNGVASSPFDIALLRRVLGSIAFVVGRTPGTAQQSEALSWLAKNSRPVRDLASTQLTRRVLERLARRIDGQPAAASTYARKRAIFHNVLETAVAEGHLSTNPLTHIKGPRRVTDPTVDRRVVVNPQQATALLEAVRADAPSLEAFFACIYYAGLRPAEVLALTEDRLELPEEGWGAIEVAGSQQATARVWTDDASTRQSRPLKHRPPGAVRTAPAPPALVAILRRHLDNYACGRRGELFVARTGKAGRPLTPPYDVTVGMNTIYRAWDRARQTALSARDYEGPLARRPYDLRHAYVSTWLSAGVSPADIANQAGHSVKVMLSMYAQQIADQSAKNQAAVDAVYDSGDGNQPKL